MTIATAFHADTYRVRVTLADLAVDGTVTIERSVNQLHWRTVRGGLELPVLSGVALLDDWEYEEGVLNTYRVVPVDPPAGLVLDATSGAYASTPDHASLDITGDCVLSAEATLADWDTAVAQTFIAKYVSVGDERSYRLFTQDGLLRLQWTTDGTTATRSSVASTVPIPAAPGERLAVRVWLDVDDGDGGHGVVFYTAPSRNGPWTRLGETVSGSGTTSVYAGSAPLEVGGINDGDVLLDGIVHWAQVWDGNISGGDLGSGTVVAEPDFSAQLGGTTSFADSAGRTWTVHGDAEVYGIETDSVTPDHDGKIILKSVRFPFLNRPIVVTDFTDPELGDRGGMFEVSGRSVPVSTPDQRASSTFTVELMTDTREQARDMQLILRANPHLFLHVPAGCPVPGGHVRVGSVTPRRPTRSAGTDRRYWPLPCRLVAPPGPQVVGGTMTYAGLLRLYGGYDNVLAANSEYADLLALMGSPEDLVVI